MIDNTAKEMSRRMSSEVRQSVFVVPAAAHIAERCQLFGAENLAVRTELVSSSTSQIGDLMAARCDVAITAIDNLFAWNAAGADITLVAQMETTTPLVLAMRPGLAALDDAPVARLGVDAPNNGFAVVLRAFMAHRGVRPEEYVLVEIGGVLERLDALERGVVDATLLSSPLDELAVSRGMALTGPSLEQVAPGYPGLGIVVSKSTLAVKRPQIVGYLRAMSRAVALMRTTTDHELAQWLSTAGYDIGAVAALRETLPESLAPSTTGLRLLAAMRTSLGMDVEHAPHPDDLVDLSVVSEAEVPVPDAR